MINALIQRLSEPLPGVEAQYRMAHTSRVVPVTPPAHARQAAVVLLLTAVEGNWRVVMIERAVHDQDKHSGQISFPGGSYQDDDGQLMHTALRETEEEVGVQRNEVQLLGALTELYIPVSNFLVQPFVGVLSSNVPMRPQAGEVQQILKPRLDFFLDKASKTNRDIVVGNGMTLRGVPAYDYKGKVIWGATAMIMNEFCELIQLIK